MILPGGIVVSILFIASGVFHQTTSHERESGALLGLYRSGVSGSKLYLAKCAANSLLLFLLTLCFSVVLGIMLEPSLLAHTLELLVVLLLTVIALTALGTLLAMISALAPTREILFPVLFFPLVLPIVGAAILLLREILFDGTIDFTSFPVKLLTSAALLYLLLGSLLFEETI